MKDDRKPTVLIFKNGDGMETMVVRAVMYASEYGEFVTLAMELDDDEVDALRRTALRLKSARGKNGHEQEVADAEHPAQG